METLNLLDRARLAGLKVYPEGDLLVVRGRPDQEPLARQILAHKAEIIEALAREPDSPRPKATCPITAEIFAVRTLADLQAVGSSDHPPGTCYACGGDAWWRFRASALWICTRCHPPRPRRKEIESWSGEGSSDG